MAGLQNLMELKQGLEGVLFYGDPHGVWQPLLDAVRDSTHTVFILGDLAEAKHHPEHIEDARDAIQKLISTGIEVHFILGNHDTDTDAVFDLVFEELQESLLDGQVRAVGPAGRKIEVAGLGGVIRGRIWNGKDAASFFSPAELLARTPRQEYFKGGLPRRQRSTIFPSEVAALAQRRTDILLTHEAPSSHDHGFAFIDDLAGDMQARLIVHGHHHFSYEARLPSGVFVRGLGLAEVWEPYSELERACHPEPTWL